MDRKVTFVPHSQMLQPINPILKYLPTEVSTGPNVDPLSLQILYLKMLSSEGRSGFPWTEPRHRTIFSQTRKGKQLSHDIWFGKSTFCSIDINIRKERIMVGIKS